MKRLVVFYVLVAVSFCAKGQVTGRTIEYTASIGMGIALSEPSYTPFMFHILGHYRISNRFSAGIGTGVSFFETTLIPLFANVKLDITRTQKFTPYAECSGGYAFAANKNANGGLHLNPSFGVRYALSDKMKLQFAAGYELQNSERLKAYANDYLTSGFIEKLSHHSLYVKVGIVF